MRITYRDNSGQRRITRRDSDQAYLGHQRITIDRRRPHYDIYRPIVADDTRPCVVRHAVEAEEQETAQDAAMARALQDNAPGADCELTDDFAARLGRSFQRNRGRIRRYGWKRFRSEPDAANAIDWLESEAYAYAIGRIIDGYDARVAYRAGSREAVGGLVRRFADIPHRGQWIAYAAVMARRYWQSRQIVVGRGGIVALLGEHDTSVSTRIEADRLRLDDAALIDVLCDYASRAGSVSDATRETITLLVADPDLSYREAADLCGLSVDGWKSRKARTLAAIRDGVFSC